MKNMKSVSLLTLAGLLAFNLSCTKEKEVIVDHYIDPKDTLKPPSIVGAINSTNGTFAFDKPHSNVNWMTEYYGDNAFLTGKFSNYYIDIVFDSKNYESTEINAWVQLSTFLTGEPGRDKLGGCGPGYMGVEYLDTNFTVDPTTDTAWFKSTSTRIEYDYYVATGSFTFKGVTKTVDMKYKFTGIHDEVSGSGAKSQKGGFKGEFMILAISDFGVTSTSIADEVYITVNANYTVAVP